MRRVAWGSIVLLLLILAPTSQAAITLRSAHERFDTLTEARLWHNSTYDGNEAKQIRKAADTDDSWYVEDDEVQWAQIGTANTLNDKGDLTRLSGQEPTYGRVKTLVLRNLEGPVNATGAIDMDLFANMTYARPAGTSFNFTWKTRSDDAGPWSVAVPKGFRIDRATGLSDLSFATNGLRVSGTSDGTADIDVRFESLTTGGTNPNPSDSTSPSADPFNPDPSDSAQPDDSSDNLDLSRDADGRENTGLNQSLLDPTAATPGPGQWLFPLLGGGLLLAVGVLLGVGLAKRSPATPAMQPRAPAVARVATLPKPVRATLVRVVPAGTKRPSAPPLVSTTLPPLSAVPPTLRVPGPMVGPPDPRPHRVRCPQCGNAVIGPKTALPECGRCGFHAWEG